MKIITATLRTPITAASQIPDIDFNENHLLASAMIEAQKRKMLYKLKNDMHEKIAILTMDDIKFEIKNSQK